MFANDIDQEKGETYVANFGSDCLTIDDIANITAKDIPNRSLLATASFPCQDLSVAGGRAGLNGSRSGTFWHFVDLLSSLRNESRHPSLVMLENVSGLLTSHGGRDLRAVLKALNECGYLCNLALVDAKWFVPQSRVRLFFFGLDKYAVKTNGMYKDVWTKWFSSHSASAMDDSCVHPQVVQAAIRRNSDLEWFPLPRLDLPANGGRTVDELLEPDRAIPKDWWYSSEKMSRMLQRMRPEHRKRVIEAVKGSRKRAFPAYWRTRSEGARLEARFDGLAGCLRTPVGGSSKQSVLLAGRGTLKGRLFSPREYARLQGVLDSFVIPQDRNAAYMAMGDAVASPAITWIAANILNPLASRYSPSVRSRAALIPA